MPWRRFHPRSRCCYYCSSVVGWLLMMMVLLTIRPYDFRSTHRDDPNTCHHVVIRQLCSRFHRCSRWSAAATLHSARRRFECCAPMGQWWTEWFGSVELSAFDVGNSSAAICSLALIKKKRSNSLVPEKGCVKHRIINYLDRLESSLYLAFWRDEIIDIARSPRAAAIM